MENIEKTKPSKPAFSAIIVIAIIITCLFTGGLIGYAMNYYVSSGNSERIADLQSQLSSVQSDLATLQSQLSRFEDSTSSEYKNITATAATLEDDLSTIQEQINEIEAEFNTGNQDSATLQAGITSLQTQVSSIQAQINALQATNPQGQTIYLLGENFSLTRLFDEVKGSVVIIQGLIRNTDFFGRVYYTQVQGSGFVYRYSGTNLILTNNHVVNGAINITVTFTNGNSYLATIRGSNQQTDFAVLTSIAPQSNYQPLEITTSSTVRVGEPVIVVGAPYGLEGSMTNGIVSALNRTLETDAGSTLTNVIQTTAPLNPGNSGGPLMNYNGQVVGITTAIVAESQGIGFAIPSDTILSEIQRIMSN
jgi:S1-C subfamily serine protease